MPRAIESEDHPIEQLPPIGTDIYQREPEIQLVDRIDDKDWLETLAFNEDPVTIRIEESAEENAPQYHLVQVNGRGAEVLIDGKWLIFGYLPVGLQVVTKRKYLEVLLRSKRTRITHMQDDAGPNPALMNVAHRATSATMAVSIIHDPSPRAGAWVAELKRRNF